MAVEPRDLVFRIKKKPAKNWKMCQDLENVSAGAISVLLKIPEKTIVFKVTLFC